MSTTYDTASTSPFGASQNSIPPYSPVRYEPSKKYPYPFTTAYSRSPTRVRHVFDELVEKTKELNVGKPPEADCTGKRRAKNLGLQVDIGRAKKLHWRSIQARRPVELTDSPTSPPRTPRRPATDYPSAEQLYLRNMVSAQKRSDYTEACRWSVFAERERAISKWEAEQEELLRAAEIQKTRDEVPSLFGEPYNLDDHEVQADWSEAYADTSPAPRVNAETTYGMRVPQHQIQQQRQMVIEVPTPPMDRSSSLRPEAASDAYDSIQNPLNPLQSMNVSHLLPQHTQAQSTIHGMMVSGNAASLPPPRLTRSSSMQRHIPATSLRMAPTPLRPRIDHHAVSYPSPQATRLSYMQPSHSNPTSGLNLNPAPITDSIQMPVYGHAEIINSSSSNGLTSGSILGLDGLGGIPGLTSIASTAVSSRGPATPNGNNNNSNINIGNNNQIHHINNDNNIPSDVGSKMMKKRPSTDAGSLERSEGQVNRRKLW